MDLTTKGQGIWVLKIEKSPPGIAVALFPKANPDNTIIGTTQIQMEDLAIHTGQILDTVRDVTLRGKRASPGETLEDLGKDLFLRLIPQGVRECLAETRPEFLLLELETGLAEFPWELLHDGGDFLACRFALGRQITEWKPGPRQRSKPVDRFPFLVISNPKGDLPEATQEGSWLSELFIGNPRAEAEWHNGKVSRSTLLGSLGTAAGIHFSGHAGVSGMGSPGWDFSDGEVTAADLERAALSAPLPLFVFSNACHIAKAAVSIPSGQQSGFTETLVRGGCLHFVGALCEILDESSRHFARAFYQGILAGEPIGLALRQARLETRTAHGKEDLTWAQYVLYGDPSDGLFGKPVFSPEARTLVLIGSCGGFLSSLAVDQASEVLAAFPESELLNTREAPLRVLFKRPSEAVRFALLLQASSCSGGPFQEPQMAFRIAVHSGEIAVRRSFPGGPALDTEGHSHMTASSLLELATSRQILATQAAFNDARAILRGREIAADGQVDWLDHGQFRFTELEEPIGVCEIGVRGCAPLAPPAGTPQAYRHISPDQEPVLGWRPALDHEIATSPGWVLVEKLGEGGFGEVWRARRKEWDETRVFKFCFRADHVRTLKREISLFRVLRDAVGDHPNIVRLYGIYLDRPPFYIAMEDVPGKDLSRWLADGVVAEIPLETRLEIVAKVADALQVAHDAGVIHRDVKPSNILLIGEPSNGRNLQVKLGDFGIGQLVSRESLLQGPLGGFTETFSPTEFISHSGSRLYMAPELLVGKPSSVRSDIYSLGVVLYQVILGNPQRPVTVDWSADIEDPLLREDLDRCLAGNPAVRFPCAADLATNLRHLERRRTERAAAERASRREIARKRFWAVLAVSLVLVSALAGALGYGLLRERWALRETEQARKTAEKELYISSIKLAEQAIREGQFANAWDYLQKSPEACRNWEWGHMAYLCSQDVATLRGHEGEVGGVAFSPQGDWLATASADQTVRIWEVPSGSEIRRLLGHSGGIWSLAVSPDGGFLATGSEDKTLKIWDTASWNAIRTLEGFQEEVRCIAFSGDGSLVAAGSADSYARVYETLTGRIVASVSHEGDLVHGVALSHDGRILATVGGREGPCECVLKVWDVETGKVLHIIPHEAQEVRAAAFSPDGRWIATGNLDPPSVRVWDWQSETLVQQLEGHRSASWSVAFSPDGRHLAAASLEGLVRIWSTETWKEEKLLAGHTRGVYAIAYSPDGRLLASVGGDKTCRLWFADPDTPSPFVFRQTGWVLVASLSQDGKWLATCGVEDPVVTIREVESGLVVQELSGHTDELRCGVFSPDGRYFAAGSADHFVRVWDWRQGALICTLSGHLSPIKSLQFSSDSRWLATGEEDGAIRVWDVSKWQEVCAWMAPEGTLTRLAWAPDGKSLAVSESTPRLSLWDPFQPRLLESVAGHTDSIRSVIFSPDGSHFATASSDFSAGLWDRSRSYRETRFQGHINFVLDAAFIGDGLRLVTASEDNTCKVWETVTGREILTLRGHAHPTEHLSTSPQSCFWASGSRDGTARLWPAFPWRRSDYPGKPDEPFKARIEAYKREFWNKRNRWKESHSGASREQGSPLATLPPEIESQARIHTGKQEGTLTQSDLQSIRYLDITVKGKIDLEGLRHFPNLNRLRLIAHEVSGATGKANCTSLRWFAFHGAAAQDLSAAGQLRGLVRLDLPKSPDLDLSQLAALQSLSRLSGIRELTSLEALKNLEHLDISHARITDLSPLAGLKKLKTLYLDHNEIRDLEPLAGLRELSDLNLSFNRIQDTRPLSALTNLTMLNLAECRIEAITPLLGLQRLVRLDLGRNPITSITPLSALKNLVDLSLAGVQIEDVTPLADLVTLRKLHLGNTGLADIDPLRGLEEIRDLTLANNPVDDISALCGKRHLRLLSLRKTRVEDLSPLLKCEVFESGSEVDLRGTNLMRNHPEQIQALEAKGVRMILQGVE